MMEENSDIFLAGGDPLVCLAGPMHKKYSTTCAWSHACPPPHPPCKHMYAFRVIVTAVGLFQKILLNTIAHMY